MRSVTAKPPKTLIAPKVTAATRERREHRTVRHTGQPGDDDDRAGKHDAVNGVSGRHQRRMQRRRHFGNHFEADEDRQHEHGQRRNELRELVQDAVPPISSAPSRAMTAPLATSSFMSTLRFPSAIHGDSSAWTLREYKPARVGRHRARQDSSFRRW